MFPHSMLWFVCSRCDAVMELPDGPPRQDFCACNTIHLFLRIPFASTTHLIAFASQLSPFPFPRIRSSALPESQSRRRRSTHKPRSQSCIS